MQIGSTGDSLTDYIVGQSLRANRQEVQAAVATKVMKIAQQAQQSVLQLLDSAVAPMAAEAPTLTAMVSGRGIALDTYA